MSNTSTESFLASVDASNIDTSLQSQRLAIPEALQSYDWRLIIAANAATWQTKYDGVQFYWDGSTHEIIATGSDADAITHAINDITPIVTDQANVDALFQSAQQLIAPDGQTKRTRTEDPTDAGEGQPAAPGNPASTLPTSLYDENTLGVNAQDFFKKSGPANMASPAAPSSPSAMMNDEHRIPNDRVGLVIGAKGATIKTIKDVSGAQINVEKVPDASGQFRIVKLSGTKDQIDRAKLEIDRVINPPSDDDSNKTTVLHPIPTESVGTVIGRGGETIRLLQMLTHCRVVMEKDDQAQQGSSTRNVELTGTPQQIAHAQQSIDKLIAAHKNATDDKPFDVNLVLTGRAAHRTIDVRVQGNIIGMVIGKGGENLKRIKDKTGVRLTVDKDTSNSVRLITIQAPNENAARSAQRAIAELIAECEKKKASHGSANNQGANVAGMYGHQMYGAINPAAAATMGYHPHLYTGQPVGVHNPAMFAAAAVGPQSYNMLAAQQQRLMPPGAAAVAPSAPAPAAAPPSAAVRTPEQQQLYNYYYQHYAQTYPPDQAAQFAEHYVKNPPS